MHVYNFFTPCCFQALQEISALNLVKSKTKQKALNKQPLSSNTHTHVHKMNSKFKAVYEL